MRRIDFGREALEWVEQTKDQIVLREKPHYLIGIFFCSMALIMIGFGFRDARVTPDPIKTVFDGFLCACFLALALYASVESTFYLSRVLGTLRVTRRLIWLTFERSYSVDEVSQVFERKTLKGNGLRMQLVSDEKKSLTLFTEYASLDTQIGMLNHFIHAARAYKIDPAKLHRS